MSEIPTILVTNGWKTDRNRKLTEVVIPSTVKTLNAPTKVTFMGTTLSAIPSIATALQEFEAPNVKVVSSSSALFSNYTALTTLKLPSLETMSGPLISGCTNLTNLYLPNIKSLSATTIAANVIHNCANLSSLDFPNLESLSNTANGGFIFNTLPSVQSITFPKLKTVADTHGASNMFYNLGNLTTLNFPVVESIKGRIFISLTSLQNVTLGSVGHPVQSIINGSGGSVFYGCTQSGLTITIYTTNGASLSSSPWGATNATIVYESA